MSVWSQVAGWFNDPPPEFVLDIGADEVAISRTRAPHAPREVQLEPGVVTPAQGKEGVMLPAALAAAVQRLIPEPLKRRTAALLIPDNSVRLAILEFDKFPDKEEERRALVKFRLRKTIPFDVDQAVVSYFQQNGSSVLAAAVPVETIARFEAPLRAAGLQPGLVMPSSVAMLELVREKGLVLVARRGSGVLSVFALRDGVVMLARVLELAAGTTDPLEEIVADLYPTMVYLEDQTGTRPSKLIIAGFGDDAEEAKVRLEVELDVPTESIAPRQPGIAGYLTSLGVSERAAA
jgi:type IV pilus assembly protein PilM